MKRLVSFPFYPDDFIGGTFYFTNEQRGAYLSALIYQFGNGSVPDPVMRDICASDAVYDVVIKKFERDESGAHINQRMKEVVESALAYSQSRRDNRKKKTYDEDMMKTSSTYDTDVCNTSLPYGEHMGSGSGSGIGDGIGIGIGINSGIGILEGGAEPNLSEKKLRKPLDAHSIPRPDGGDELQSAWDNWLEARRKNRVPATARGLKQAIAKLEEYAKSEKDKIAMLDTASERGWRGIFPLTENRKVGGNGTGRNNTQQHGGYIDPNWTAPGDGKYHGTIFDPSDLDSPI